MAAPAHRVFPPINGGLHCGCLYVAGQVENDMVFPPINGGLHCGTFADAKNFKIGGVFPPINGGLHCGGCTREGRAPSGRCVPAYQRRAPLRLPGRCARWRVARQVFPPINGGLHCGPDISMAFDRMHSVFPPINGGLHCGNVPAGSTMNYQGTCSRLSTAGAIAAGA